MSYIFYFYTIKSTIRIPSVFRVYYLEHFYPISIIKVSKPKFPLVEVWLCISNTYRGFSECIVNKISYKLLRTLYFSNFSNTRMSHTGLVMFQTGDVLYFRIDAIFEYRQNAIALSLCILLCVLYQYLLNDYTGNITIAFIHCHA